MDDAFNKFITIVRNAGKYNITESGLAIGKDLHPFDERNIHPEIEELAKKLFDDGHYSQATFEAFKFVDKCVQKLAKSSESGKKLMMKAFGGASPQIRLTNLSKTSEKDEQEGYQFIFAGSVMAIRNPRGHEVSLSESPDQCLDHISLASMLVRRLKEVGSDL